MRAGGLHSQAQGSHCVAAICGDSGWMGSAKARGSCQDSGQGWDYMRLFLEVSDGQGPGELTRLFLEVSDEAAGPRS